jgi:hypothetical protein
MNTFVARARWTAAITLRLGFLVALIAGPVVGLIDPHPPWFLLIHWPWLPEWIFVPLLIVKLILNLYVGIAAVARDSDRLSDRPAHKRRSAWSVLAAGLTNVAVLLAGRRRTHVREAWLSDLVRPRDLTGEDVPGVSRRRKVIYSAGLVKAAVCYRIDDATVLWWHLADGVLASRACSRLLLTGPCAMAIVMIVNREGFYGLIANAENLLAIGTVSAGLVYGGRKLRKVAPKAATRQKETQT